MKTLFALLVALLVLLVLPAISLALVADSSPTQPPSRESVTERLTSPLLPGEQDRATGMPAKKTAIPKAQKASKEPPSTKGKTRVKVMELAKSILASAQKRDWSEYCNLLSPYSRYNLALNIAGTKTCPEALAKKKGLANRISKQSQVLRIDKIKTLNKNIVAVDVSLRGKFVQSFISLRYQGIWGGDLHPPRTKKDLLRVTKKLTPDRKIPRKVTPQPAKQANIGCVPSFLIKPIRRELSVDLNQ